MPATSNPFPPDSSLYETLQTLLSRPTPPLLPKAPWNALLTAAIDEAPSSVYVRAALHLLNDDLDRAHRLVQAHEGNQTADYLHMLVHRREGDWSNTGYWVRRTGPHPIYAALTSGIAPAPDSALFAGHENEWDPNRMVELSRQASVGKPDAQTADAVTALSAWEMAEAVAWCVRNAA